MADWSIERLEEKHDRAGFLCGKESLDTFIRRLVTQYERRRLGRTYVAVESGSTRVAGYYTLAAGSLEATSLPKQERKKLPKHPIPTIHLGRLAVDHSFRGKRLGELLLFHALRTSRELTERLGVFAVDVWAIDDDASGFYRRYGFIPLEDVSLHLYLPMKSIDVLFDSL